MFFLSLTLLRFLQVDRLSNTHLFKIGTNTSINISKDFMCAGGFLRVCGSLQKWSEVWIILPPFPLHMGAYVQNISRVHCSEIWGEWPRPRTTSVGFHRPSGSPLHTRNPLRLTLVFVPILNRCEYFNLETYPNHTYLLYDLKCESECDTCLGTKSTFNFFVWDAWK